MGENILKSKTLCGIGYEDMSNGLSEENLKCGILRNIFYSTINVPQIRIYQILSNLEDRPERNFYKDCIQKLIDEGLLDLEGNFEDETGLIAINARGINFLKIHCLET